jgi:uncharacterized protein YbjT (DUF2867 family)
MTSTPNPRAVVFGAGGLLGQALLGHMAASGIGLAAAPRGRAEGDITNPKLVAALLDRFRHCPPSPKTA